MKNWEHVKSILPPMGKSAHGERYNLIHFDVLFQDFHGEEGNENENDFIQP
jgi:hypothetical protein